MAITGVNNYGNVYDNMYASQKKQTEDVKNKETGKISDALEVKTEAAKKSSNEEYLKRLHSKFPGMKFQLGYGISAKDEGNNDIYMLSVNPKLLEKMQNSSEAEKEYTQRIKDIERAIQLTDTYMKSRGRTAKWVNNYIDENGKYYHSSCWVYKDELNEKLRKEAQENAEKQIEETRNNAREKAEQLAESLDKKTEEAKEAEKKAVDLLAKKLENTENGDVYLGDKDAQMIIEVTKEQKKSGVKSEVVGSNLDLMV